MQKPNGILTMNHRPSATVRRAGFSDLQGVLKLYRKLFPGEDYSDVQNYRHTWRTIMSRDGIMYFVAVEDGMVVAPCAVCIVPNLTRNRRPYALIENVITHPKRRRAGYGTAVIKKAVGHAREQGCYKVMLLSKAVCTEAHTFYEKIGFDGDSKKGFQIRFP